MSAVAELDHETLGSSPTSSAGQPQASSEALPGSTSETSGVTSASQTGTRSLAGRPAPSEEQLLDVLYEVLVQGPPARSTLTREDVEQFLHQHARKSKPLSEMLAFFDEHDLPTEPREYGADQELKELATGLQRERNSLAPGFGPGEPEPERVVSPSPQTFPPATQVPVAVAQAFAPQSFAPASEPLENEKTGRRVAPLSQPSKGLRWLVAIAASLALVAAAAFAVNYKRAASLEERLDQARMQQRSTDVALTKLEQRAETLQGALQQSEVAREKEASELKTTLEEQAKKRATEEQAIERVLGPRYLKLRQKLTEQQAAPAR